MSSLNAGMGSASGNVLEIGFAKLHGQEFDYYIQFYEIILGRNTKKEKVDLDLTAVGGAKDISRRHACIYYDFKDHTFALEVLGKSGCYVQRVLYLPGDYPVKLDSQDHIQIGDIQFYFLHANLPIDKRIAALGTPQSFTFRGVTYHVDPATGSVEHTPIADVIRRYKLRTPIRSQPMSATASAHEHTHFPSQPMSATASARHTHTPSQPNSATASAQHNRIPSQPLSSSCMRPVNPDFYHGTANGGHGTQGTFMKQNNRSLVGLDLNLEPIIEILEEHGINVENSHGSTNGDNGIIAGTGIQGNNMEQNNRSFGELDLNVEPIGTIHEDGENGHGLANGDRGNIIGTRTEGTSMEQNNRSFGELDLNVEPIGALDEHVENGRDLVNGDSRIIVGTGTQRTSLEKNNRSFGELNVEPTGTLNKHVENGHVLANGGSGIIVGTGTQRMEQINRSLVELNLNVEPIGIFGEHVDEVEIRTDKDPDNLHLRQKEENDLLAYVASIVLKRPSPDGWVPAADVHAQLVAHFSKIWPSSRVHKYLASEAGSSSGAVEKPWHKLLELLSKCPEKFVTCSVSRGTERADFVGFLHPPVVS